MRSACRPGPLGDTPSCPAICSTAQPWLPRAILTSLPEESPRNKTERGEITKQTHFVAPLIPQHLSAQRHPRPHVLPTQVRPNLWRAAQLPGRQVVVAIVRHRFCNHESSRIFSEFAKICEDSWSFFLCSRNNFQLSPLADNSPSQRPIGHPEGPKPVAVAHHQGRDVY